MKGCREAKRRMALIRALYGKRNGVIPAGCLDDLRLERLLYNSKRKRQAIRARKA